MPPALSNGTTFSVAAKTFRHFFHVLPQKTPDSYLLTPNFFLFLHTDLCKKHFGASCCGQ